MKKFALSVLALAVFAGFASCDDENTEEPQQVTLSVAPLSVTLSLSDKSPQRVTVTTNATSWTAVPENQWVKVEQNVGGGISTFRLLTI